MQERERERVHMQKKRTFIYISRNLCQVINVTMGVMFITRLRARISILYVVDGKSKFRYPKHIVLHLWLTAKSFAISLK